MGLIPARSAWLAILLYHAVLIAALALRRQPRVDLRVAVGGFSFGPALVAVGAAGVFGLALYRGLIALDPSGAHLARYLSRVGLAGSAAIPFCFYVSTVNPVLEELYWRGNFRDRHRTAVVDDLCYSLFHLPIYCFWISPRLSVIPVVTLIGAGLFWRGLARRQGGLAVAVIGHAAGDVAVLSAVAAACARHA